MYVGILYSRDFFTHLGCGVVPPPSSQCLWGGAVLTVFSVVPLVQAVTINYHHTTGSRAPSLDDDEEEEDRLHAMISMICSRNLTDPNVMKGFYHLNTPTQPYRPHPPRPHPSLRCPSPPPTTQPDTPYQPLLPPLPRPPPASSACMSATRGLAQQCAVGWGWLCLHCSGEVQVDALIPQ